MGGTVHKDNTLIHFPTVAQIDKFIDDTIIHTNALETDVNPALNKFVAWGKKKIHSQWSVIEALEKGFLIHYGQLSLVIRMLELALFNN